MTHMISNMNNIISQNGIKSSSNPIYERKDIFPDVEKLDGPLQVYRQKSTFDWRKLRLIVEDIDTWTLRYNIWNFMEKHPDFARNHETLPLDEQRHVATRQMFLIQNESFYGIQDYLARPDLAGKYSTSLVYYDPSTSVKTGLSFGMFPSTIRSLGQSENVLNIVEENQKMENVGCFALTEIAHGSNSRGMRTTATYDVSSKSFIINTPDFEAAKCWIGNLGKTATHAVVYAQLYTPDGKCHGLNAFVVPIRNTKTFQAFAGVTVGDLGEKIGLNGIDNGFVLFNNYKIPKENLLSRTGDVNNAGEFVSQYKDARSRMGKSLGALSGGRVNICEIAAAYGTRAMTIAIRYAASRKQFGPDDSDIEYPVIEYQAQQNRLLPHFANLFAVKFFSTWFGKVYGNMTMQILMGEDTSAAGVEMHGLSSAAKPVCTWLVRDMIQECREACGGHGYLKCSQLGELRNVHDASCTYEGENNILIQQASNYLINARAKGYEAFKTNSPLGTASFLANGEEIKRSKFTWKKVDCAMKPENLLKTFDWICVFLLEKSFEKVKELKSSGQSTFDARNNSQVFYAIDLAIAYGHHSIFSIFLDTVQNLDASPEKDVLMKLVTLYGSNTILTKYMGILYEGGFVQQGINAGNLFQTGILNLLPMLKTEAISLVDSIAPPDFIVNSPLGMSDGRIYDHLKSTLYQSPEVFERPSWWKDMAHRDYVKSKL